VSCLCNNLLARSANGKRSYNQGCNQIDVIYVSPLLKEFEYELKEIDEGICGADHRAMILAIPTQALGIGAASHQRPAA